LSADATRSPKTPLNPFYATTTIRFSIAKLSIVDLKIYDLLGREVETLVHGEMNAGLHEVTFDATKFASGQLRGHEEVNSFEVVFWLIATMLFSHNNGYSF